jgi:hypothetical protein
MTAGFVFTNKQKATFKDKRGRTSLRPPYLVQWSFLVTRQDSGATGTNIYLIMRIYNVCCA